MSAKTKTIRVRISPGVRVWQAVLVAAALVASLLLGLVIGRANGNRATPDQVLSEFAERMAGTYGIDDVLERMSLILAQGTGATRVDVWLRVGRELRPVAAWPADAGSHAAIPLLADDALPAFDGVTRAVAVRHGDELLGALALEKPRNELLSPTEDKAPAGSRVASRPGPSERPSDRGAPSQHRRAPGVASTTRRGAGRRAAQDRAEPP
jgi:hypothetical protein